MSASSRGHPPEPMMILPTLGDIALHAIGPVRFLTRRAGLDEVNAVLRPISTYKRRLAARDRIMELQSRVHDATAGTEPPDDTTEEEPQPRGTGLGDVGTSTV